MKFLKRWLKAMHDNAGELHDFYCEGPAIQNYSEPNEPVEAKMYCKHCGCEVLPDEDTHVCTNLEPRK